MEAGRFISLRPHPADCAESADGWLRRPRRCVVVLGEISIIFIFLKFVEEKKRCVSRVVGLFLFLSLGPDEEGGRQATGSLNGQSIDEMDRTPFDVSW